MELNYSNIREHVIRRVRDIDNSDLSVSAKEIAVDNLSGFVFECCMIGILTCFQHIDISSLITDYKAKNYSYC